MANHSDPVEAAKRGTKKQESPVPDGVKEAPTDGLEPIPAAGGQPPSAGFYRPDDVADYKPLPKQAAVVDVIRASDAEAPPTISQRVRLTHDWRGSLYGQMIWLKAGEILDKGHYGEEGFKRLRDGGLRFESLKEE